MSSEDVMTEYHRQSFSGRICDDLCEVVINWLPLKDKLRLKSVSKQFKTCLAEVLTRETVLILRDHSKDLRNYERRYGSALDVKSLSMILKSMTNITDIFCETFFRCTGGNEVLSALTDHCHDLRTVVFMFDYDHDSDGVFERFGAKFGHSLRSLKNTNHFVKDLSPILKACTGLVSLSGHEFTQWNHFRHLKQSLEFQSLDDFEDRYQTLRALDIHLTEDSADLSFKVFACLPKLEKLSIDLVRIDSHQEYRRWTSAEGLASIAMNCKRMACLNIKFFIRCYLNENQLFDCFQHFRQLVRLEIILTIEGSYQLDMSCLKTCHRLTHLSVCYNRITDNTLDAIAEAVPNVKTLALWAVAKITDKALIAISKLKKLVSIQLSANLRLKDMNSITDLGFVSLVESCLHLKTITISEKTKITRKSFDAVMGKALKYPDIDFRYELPIDKKLKNEVIEAIDSSVHSLANLHINYLSYY